VDNSLHGPLPKRTQQTAAGLPLDAKKLPQLIAGAVVAGLAVMAILVSLSSRTDLGIDYGFYRDVGARFLEDGTYYLPHQLAGPYPVTLMVDVLYPPAALLLFVPFVWLPAVLWWAIPLGILGYVVWSYRPGPWTWLTILCLAAWPRTVGAIMFGNTDMWVAAGIAGGLRWGWPVALVALKPVFLPFAVIGIRDRWTWVVGLGLLVVSLPMLADYITAMRNVQTSAIQYSIGSMPFALLPIVASLGATRGGWSSWRTARRTPAGPARLPSTP
jgi:hypothetical protein